MVAFAVESNRWPVAVRKAYLKKLSQKIYSLNLLSKETE
ncbi:MAG: hypothetical protein ACI9Z9_002041 [Litorivivens sp.]|jgi:hypothetical protein